MKRLTMNQILFNSLLIGRLNFLSQIRLWRFILSLIQTSSMTFQAYLFFFSYGHATLFVCPMVRPLVRLLVRLLISWSVVIETIRGKIVWTEILGKMMKWYNTMSHFQRLLNRYMQWISLFWVKFSILRYYGSTDRPTDQQLDKARCKARD